MRKAINGLSGLVANTLEMDPMSGHYFVFCRREKNTLKVLYYDRNGYALWYMRLEENRFPWPATEARAKLFFFEEQARIRAAQLFGRHSEKWRREEQLQAILFNELELALQEAPDAQPERIETDDEQVQKKKQARQAKREQHLEGGRSPLP